MLKGANRGENSMLTVHRAQSDGDQVLEEVAEVHDVCLEGKPIVDGESQTVTIAKLLNSLQRIKLPTAEIGEKVDHTFAEGFKLGVLDVKVAVTELEVFFSDGPNSDVAKAKVTLDAFRL